MKMESLIIAILFFACGSKAENNTLTEEVSKNEIEILVKSKEMLDKAIDDVVVEEIDTIKVEETILPEVEQVDAKAMGYHILWNIILKWNVDTVGKVNYKGMKASLSN
jgi:hypothetical protein